ncbi:MAG TPA: anthranilate synthase component I, partial [Ruminococcaceae bacterium]|nr:anthranilate synthase component I [Oscillospiraceae bacterium]
MGYFAYDYAKYAEPALKLNAGDKEHFQDVDLMLFDKVIAFDHYKQKIVLIVNIRTENLEAEYMRGVKILNEMKALIKKRSEAAHVPSELKSDFKALFSKDEYREMVETAKKHIKEGDIFQVVLSNRFEADFEGSLFDSYRVLRTLNPSPYM